MKTHLKLALLFSVLISSIASIVITDDKHIDEGAQSLPILMHTFTIKILGHYYPKTTYEDND